MFKFNETSGCTNIRQIPPKEFFQRIFMVFFLKFISFFQWTLNKYNIRQCVNETLWFENETFRILHVFRSDNFKRRPPLPSVVELNWESYMVFDPVEKLSEWILENAFELRSKILVTFVVSWSKTTSKDLIWPIIRRENFELKFKSTQTLGTQFV